MLYSESSGSQTFSNFGALLLVFISRGTLWINIVYFTKISALRSKNTYYVNKQYCSFIGSWIQDLERF